MSNKRVFEIFCYLPKALKQSELQSETNFKTLYNLLLSLNHESKQASSVPCYSKNLRFQVSDFLLLAFIKPIPPLDQHFLDKLTSQDLCNLKCHHR